MPDAVRFKPRDFFDETLKEKSAVPVFGVQSVWSMHPDQQNIGTRAESNPPESCAIVGDRRFHSFRVFCSESRKNGKPVRRPKKAEDPGAGQGLRHRLACARTFDQNGYIDLVILGQSNDMARQRLTANVPH